MNLELPFPLTKNLVMEDIQGSIAHVTMLAKHGILTAEEADQINKGLKRLKEKAANDELEFSVAMEDIHLKSRKYANRFNWSSWWKASYR